jgi:outer membrane protein TolC
VEDDVVAFLQEQDRVKSLDKSTRAAARSVEIATLQYEKGMIAYQPLLDSERALVQQQDALAESRGSVGMDLVAIYKALGGGWRARLPDRQGATAEPIPPGVELPAPVPTP